MDKIEKIKEWVEKEKKGELTRNSLGVITGSALYIDANKLLSFIANLDEPSEDLEKAAEEYANSIAQFDIQRIYSKDDFKAGAEWQKSQMLKDAVEGEVQYFGETQGVPRTIHIPRMQEWLKPFKDGDKVRIVALKEEEE